LKTDIAAVRQAKAGRGQLKALLQPLRAQLAQQRAEVKAAAQSAAADVKALRTSFGH